MEIISRYSDNQAIEDGYLVDVTGLNLKAGNLPVDRCTVGAWVELGNLSTRVMTGEATQEDLDNHAILMLRRICQGWSSPWVEWEKTAPEDDERMIKVETAIGWLWAVENERGNYTIMLPEDY